jgi:PAS domain S-box-containing protein
MHLPVAPIDATTMKIIPYLAKSLPALPIASRTSDKVAHRAPDSDPHHEADFLIYFRHLMLFAAVFIPAFGFIHKTINPQVVEPFAERFALAFVCLAVYILSHVSENVRKRIVLFAYIVFYIISFWTIRLLILNQFAIDYIYGLIIVIYGSVGLKRHTDLAIYYFAIISILMIAYHSSIRPQVSEWLLLCTLAASGFISYVIFSARIKLQEELVTNEKLLKLVFNESADALFLVDADSGAIVDYNDRALALFGIADRDRFIGVRIDKLLAPDRVGTETEDRAGSPPWLSSFTEEGKYTALTGRDFWGDLAVRRIHINNEMLLLVRLTDITERKRAEEALRHSEERYRSLVENTQDGYFILEAPSGKCLFLNHRICQLFGYPMQEAASLSVWDVVAPEDEPLFRDLIEEMASGQKPIREPHVLRLIRKDGTIFQAEVSTSLVYFRGAPAIQGTLRDVTEREHLQRQLQHAQKMQAVGTLAGGVAHEFNNILAGIQGYAQLMDWQLESDHPVSEYLDNIEEGCRRAAALTQKMLAFSQPESGQALLVKVNQVIKGVQGFLKPTLPHRIVIRTELENHLPFVMVDPAQLEQVLLHLTVNAVDAMPGGGSICIRTRLADLDDGFWKAHPLAEKRRYVEVTVEDSGPGIPEDILEHIFEPFFTTKEPGKGTGLGLSIVYSIVKSYKGYIFTDTRPDHGSLFRLFFPAAEDPEGTSGARDDDSLPQGRGECILLTDDEACVRETMEEILTANGYRVSTAEDGEEALKQYKRHAADNVRPALVILDLAMPNMDGEACMEQLRDTDPGVQVLLVTGYGGQSVDARLGQGGAQGILFKPFDAGTLLREVRRILDSAAEESTS